jgi:fibrillarin-like rRNA methylase
MGNRSYKQWKTQKSKTAIMKINNIALIFLSEGFNKLWKIQSC